MFILQGLGLASISFNQPSSVDSNGDALGAPRIFTYQSNVDTVATISATDYFLPMYQMATVGDVIYIQATDATIFLTFDTISDTSVTTAPTITITSGDIADGSVSLIKLAPDVFANFLQVGNNLNDLGNVATARGNLGLGSAALLDVTDFLRPSQNLTDVANATTSFNNISPITTKGDLIVGNGANSSTRLGVGTDGFFLEADNTQPTGLKWSSVSIPTGSSVTKNINQAAHGFSVENILTFTGGAYVLAEADNLANSQVVGMVDSVIDVDNFVLLIEGYTTNLAAKVSGASYWLSSTVAGLLTNTEPSAAGEITRALLRTDSTTSGYFSLGKSTFTTATWLQTANNLSDILSQSTARTNLGLGTAATHATGDFLQTANNLSDLTNAGTARTNLGLGTMAVVNSPVPVANGGTGSSTPGATAANNIGALAIASNLSDLNSATTARTNLGLGTAATFPASTFAQTANNLSDLLNAVTARSNLGLGSAATFASTAFAQTANNLSDLANTATALTNLGGVSTATTITVAGTANEITSSAGAQNLSTNRTWTLSLPSALTFTGKTITGGTLSGVDATTFTFTSGTIGTAVTGVTQAALKNDTTIATTQYVDSAVAAGGGAPTNATYITQTPNGSLSNEQALSALATGIMKSTTATGVVSIAALGTDYYGPGGTDVPVADGGTGVSSLTAYAVVCGGTTSTSPVQSIASIGSSGQVLTSNGAGALPTFQAAATGGVNPGYISTNWYPSGSVFGGTGQTTATKTRPTGTLYFHPIYISKTTTFTNIGILLSTTAAGTSVLGLYNDNGNSAPTGSPITNSNSGSITNTASTFSSYTFSSPITLVAGIYWTAHSTSGTSTFAGPPASTVIGGRGLGINATPTLGLISTPVCGWSQPFTYSATLPSVGTLTSQIAYSPGDAFVFLQAQ